MRGNIPFIYTALIPALINSIKCIVAGGQRERHKTLCWLGCEHSCESQQGGWPPEVVGDGEQGQVKEEEEEEGWEPTSRSIQEGKLHGMDQAVPASEGKSLNLVQGWRSDCSWDHWDVSG